MSIVGASGGGTGVGIVEEVAFLLKKRKALAGLSVGFGGVEGDLS